MTEAVKHTPGKWYCVCEDVENAPVGDSGLRFWSINQDNPDGYRGTIASVYSAEHIGGITVPERNANAHLIAAAPELLEALKPFAAVFEKDIGSDETDGELFQVNNNNRAPKLTVGDFRRAYQALFEAEGR